MMMTLVDRPFRKAFLQVSKSIKYRKLFHGQSLFRKYCIFIQHQFSLEAKRNDENESRSWHINKKIRFSRMYLSYEALALSRSSPETNSHDTGLNKSLLVLVFYFRPFCQFQPSHVRDLRYKPTKQKLFILSTHNSISK